MIRNMRRSALTAALAASLGISATASAQLADDDIDALVEAREIPVTIDNFARAASDIELDKYVTLAGGINRFYPVSYTHLTLPTNVSMCRSRWWP